MGEVGWPDGPFGQNDPYRSYGGYGSPYASSQLSATAGLDTTDATAVQSQGIVMISTVVDFGSGQAAGTGMVIDGDDGIVVTNHHVVEGSTEVQVTATGETFAAQVLGTDATHDVAVLRLEDAPTLTEITPDTSVLSSGDPVTAVGDAGGDGGTLTAAAGTVTDVREPVTVSDDAGGSTTMSNLVEIDADIIAGDSGGALLDADGDVIGMNVAASTGTSNITGYAIPVRRVLRIAQAVVAQEESATVSLGYDAFLGVQLATSDGPATLVGVLADGPAAAAGLVAGDTVTAVDGTSTPTTTALRGALCAHDADDTVPINWTDAAGVTHSVVITLDRAPVA